MAATGWLQCGHTLPLCEGVTCKTNNRKQHFIELGVSGTTFTGFDLAFCCLQYGILPSYLGRAAEVVLQVTPACMTVVLGQVLETNQRLHGCVRLKSKYFSFITDFDDIFNDDNLD